jgi:thioredoxin 1
MIQHLTTENFDKQIHQGVTLVDFYANWCGPCRMLAPVLEEISKNTPPGVTIAKIDIDNEQTIASRFEIASIPTMILFKDGKEVGRTLGLKNKEAIMQFIGAVVHSK